MKKIICMVVTLMLLAGLTACAQNAEPPADTTPSAEQPGKIVIGVSMKTMSDTYSNKLGEAIKAAAENYSDVELLLMDAQADVSKQISNVEDLVAKKVNVIILNAQDVEGSGAALDICEEAGIPVIEVNTITTKTNYLSYVGSDDVQAGELVGMFVNEQLGGKGKVCILEGIMGQSPQILRYQGIQNTLLKEPGIEVLATQSVDWQRDKAMSTTEDWLSTFKEIDAIVSENDDMAMGAVEAIQAAGREGIIVIGVDAVPDALKAVSEGKLSATVLQDAIAQANTVVEVAYKAGKGEKVEKEYIVPFQLITKDNVDDFI